MMVVSYPNNPTTAHANKDFYEKLVSFAKKYDIIVFTIMPIQNLYTTMNLVFHSLV